MGSATCFPVESIIFASMALTGVWMADGQPRISSWVHSQERADIIRVFGDDIIVPNHATHQVLSVLCALGAKPNPTKSFWSGLFRESCGQEYYAGESVSVARLRKRLPENRRDASEVLSLVSLRNHLYDLGFWRTTRLLDEWLSDIRVPMPIVEPTSPVVGRQSVAFGYQVERYHPDTQAPLVKGIRVRAPSPVSTCSGEAALLKCLLPGRTEPFADVDHLTRSGRPETLFVSLGWGTPF